MSRVDHQRALSSAHFAQMKHWYFVQNAASRLLIFQVQAIKTGHILIICRQTGDIWYIVSFQQRNCRREVMDKNFKITLQILQVLTPKFHSNSVSALCKLWLQWIASVMQWLLTLQNHCYKTWSLHFAKLKSDQFYSTQIKLPWLLYMSWVIPVVGPNLEILFCTQQCSVHINCRVEVRHSFISTTVLEESQVTPQGSHR